MMGAKRLRITSTLIALATAASILTGLGAGAAGAATPTCASSGCWTAPFSPFGQFDKAPPQTVAESERYPAAASLVMMPNGRIVYWNGLQGLENCGQGIPVDGGVCAGNAHTQLLDLTGSSPIFITNIPTAPGGHDDLFCSDQRLLENGTVLDTGGTNWVTEEPKGGTGIPGVDGLTELYGSRNTRVFDPNAPTSAGWKIYSNAMHDGRWYPTMLTLPNGNEFVAGGVTKLLWNSSIMTQVENAIGNPQYQQATFPLPENVQTTETWSLAHGGWTLNPAKDNVELPLFARLHLLPDGEIFYAGNGQMWGPAGESINELNWNNLMLFDPSKIGTSADQGWQKAGMLTLGAMSGSASVLMPLDASKPGGLNTVHVLVAGGAVGVSPDTYLASNISQLVTLTKTSSGWSTSVAQTGNLNNRRWFSSSVLLPNGQVLVFNGADKDEVILPGSEMPVHQTELFDPATNTWTGLSSSGRDRTYHNSAILLPDGSVLVGGHAPVNQGYGGTGNALPLDQLGFVHNLKDPSFERFSPPYLFAGPRPQLVNSDQAATWGGTLHTVISPNGAPVDRFVLTRLPSQTHITDADARTVILGPGQRDGNSVSLDIPTNRAAVTPGFYYLFGISAKGVPSIATIVQIADPAYLPSGKTSVKPVHLAAQEFRGSIPGSNSAEQPAALATAAKKAASSQPVTPVTKNALATDVVVPAGTPVAPATTSRAWLIVLAGLMIAIVARRVLAAARR